MSRFDLNRKCPASCLHAVGLGVSFSETLLLSLSTIAGAKASDPPWVNFQSAAWVSFQSAPTVSGLQAGYGLSQVLFDMHLKIEQGQVVSLIGRNGMGKTTTVKSIMGLLKPTAGSVLIHGKEMRGAPPYRIAQAGLGLVPEGRRSFGSLSVRENLLATSTRGKWDLSRIYQLFPRLQERQDQLSKTLSGGEQQMMVVARALLTNPQLLILDEATEGLAPIIRATIWSCLASLKDEGETILVIDKNLKEMARVVDYHHIIEKGRQVWHGTPAQLAETPELSQRYLGV